MSIHDHVKALCKEPRYELGRATQALSTIGLDARLYVRMPPRTGKTTLATALMLQALDFGQHAIYVGPNKDMCRVVWSNIAGVNSIITSDEPPVNVPRVVPPQTALCGKGFNFAVMDMQFCKLPVDEQFRWYQDTLRSRLFPDGSVIYIEPTEARVCEPSAIPFETFRQWEPRWQLIDLT